MTHEEKRAWIMVVVSVAAYAAYLIVILGRAGNTPLVAVSYVPTLLWSVAGAIVASILLSIVAAIIWPTDSNLKDQRDKEIGRFGEHVGQSFGVIGGGTALILAMAEANHFWIANTIYLGFALSSVLGSVAKIAAYRWGFQAW